MLPWSVPVDFTKVSIAMFGYALGLLQSVVGEVSSWGLVGEGKLCHIPSPGPRVFLRTDWIVLTK